MWGHYTNNHKGMVIGFKIDKDTFVLPLPFPKKVTYQKNKINAHLSNFNKVSEDLIFQKSLDNMIWTKSEHWSYEKEWRTGISLQNTDTKRINEKDVNGFVKINPKSIVEVILGVNADKLLEEQIRELKNTDDNYKNLKILKASMNLQEYKLDIEKIQV